MQTVIISSVIFAIVFIASLFGAFYRRHLTEHHLMPESRDFVLSLGLDLATVIAAFVLALMVTGAQANFNERRSELTEISSKIILFNQIMVDYGPETKEARLVLRNSLANTIYEYWPDENAAFDMKEGKLTEDQSLYGEIIALKPGNYSQRILREKALDLSFELEETRNLLVIQKTKNIPQTFLVVIALLVFWFMFIFFSLGIYAPSNSTVILMLLLAALSVAIAFFIIIDMSLPFSGVLRIPSDILIETLEYIGNTGK